LSRKTISKPIVIHRTETVTTYRCDGCGRLISRDDREGLFAHELVISLDGEECVNFYRQRDFCPDCLEPVWLKVNELLNADPEAERDRDY
jgi:predicted RNA-binding Zn-ribbon protein involved in translation (DUF1610 family)